MRISDQEVRAPSQADTKAFFPAAKPALPQQEAGNPGEGTEEGMWSGRKAVIFPAPPGLATVTRVRAGGLRARGEGAP